jgi:hypothetical protein
MTTLAFPMRPARREPIAIPVLGTVPNRTHQSTVSACRYECASRLKRLLQRRLVWYGFRGVSIGPIRDCGDESVLVDLRDEDGRLLCWVQINPFTGELRPAGACRALAHCLAETIGRDDLVSRVD